MDINKITIDLDRSRRSRSFEEQQERLWQDDLERILEIINSHIDNLARFNTRHKPSHLNGAPNLSLAIFGPAGSGKSSLLKTLVYEAQKTKKTKEDEVGASDKHPLGQVTSLAILQPRQFGSGDHLLYATVAAALDAHNQKSPGNQLASPVLQAYWELSEHLRVVHEEKVPEDIEPSALTAEVVQRHTSGLRLNPSLHVFFNELATSLNDGDPNSVVLLPVDDLDLNPEHLFRSLCQLQAYLLHPRLIPVFCFTDRLAEEILAGEFAKNVSYADQKRSKSSRLRVSEQLALHYLAKCFPIRNRIRLGPSPAILQAVKLAGPLPRREQEPNSGEPILLTLTAASVLLFGVPDRTSRHPVRTALRPSTLRRQFHVLDSMRQAHVDELISSRLARLLKIFDREIGEKLGEDLKLEKHWGDRFDRAAWALMNVHRDVLREYGLFLEDLYSWTPHALRRLLLDSLFRLNGDVQFSIWQRWRSLTDSRRSQVVSLLAANCHRPWLPGEVPSGEDIAQMSDYKLSGQGSGKEASDLEAIAAPVALVWFLDLVIGFYLPLSRSVYRQIQTGGSGTTETLGGAGWSFHSGPIQAALAADDDLKLFPTGMMFLDPLSYATALTTAPRIAACRNIDDIPVVDDVSAGREGDFWDTGKKLKVALLSTRTSKMLGSALDEVEAGDPAIATEPPPPSHADIQKAVESIRNGMPDFSTSILRQYLRIAAWEAGKLDKCLTAKLAKSEKAELGSSLRDHDYPRAYQVLERQKEPLEESRKAIRGLEAAAEAVHDDQLILRIWTCYGYNRGRFWAAVSLWRGLGLMGELIEAYRQWRTEEHGSSQKQPFGPEARPGSSGIARKIAGVLHTHSFRGLVPGKDLGGPTHHGTLELAFSAWNSDGQRAAIDRLALRLESWLSNSWKLSVHPMQTPNDLRWSRCFVRRLHGGYIVGALWQWLDAENLEHQGEQYGQHRGYYWNAGVALTSWLRVVQRYFGGIHEIRWLLETCPLVGPFLSRSARDPFLGQLRAKPYWQMLQSTATLCGKNAKVKRTRDSERFRHITDTLLEAWQNPASWHAFCGTPRLTGARDLDIQSAKKEAKLLLRRLVPDYPGKEHPLGTPLASAIGASLENTTEISQHVKESVWTSSQHTDADAEETSLLAAYIRVANQKLNDILSTINDIKASNSPSVLSPGDLDLLSKVDQLDVEVKSLEERSVLQDEESETILQTASLLLAEEKHSGSNLQSIFADINNILKSACVSWSEDQQNSPEIRPLCEKLNALSRLSEDIASLRLSIETEKKAGSLTQEERGKMKQFRAAARLYRRRVLETFYPRLRTDGTVDLESLAFELASIVQQHWKVTAHASAASLFYQLPRVRRRDFFDLKNLDSSSS